MDTSTILDPAGIAGLVALAVQVFVLPLNLSAARVRQVSTVLGAIALTVAEFTQAGAHLSLYGVETAAVQGAVLGAGLTYGVAVAKATPSAVKAVAAKLPRVRLSAPAPAPETPAAN